MKIEDLAKIVQSGFADIDKRFNDIELKIDALEKKVDALQQEVVDFKRQLSLWNDTEIYRKISEMKTRSKRR